MSNILDEIRLRLYKNINPSGYYTPVKRVWNAVVKNTPEYIEDPFSDFVGRKLEQGNIEDLKKYQAHNPREDYFMDKGLENDIRNALWAKYLGLSDEQVGFKISDYIEESPYKPPHAKDGEKYYRIKPDIMQVIHPSQNVKVVPNKTKVSNPWKNGRSIADMFLPDSIEVEKYPIHAIFGNNIERTHLSELPVGYKAIAKGYGLGEFTVGHGKDANGEYTSYYDEWDLNPFKGVSSHITIPGISNIKDASIGLGTPIKLYDRVPSVRKIK